MKNKNLEAKPEVKIMEAVLHLAQNLVNLPMVTTNI